MKLTALKLKNFKSHAAFELDTSGGRSVTVRGRNGAGKTTLADAHAWLLTGKDSAGRADFDIKPLDSAGNESRNLQHEVTAVYELDGGKRLELTRILQERHETTKGSAAKEYKGNTTAYRVNGVPIEREKDFVDHVRAAFGPEEQVRCLTEVDYFCGRLPWQRRRAILLELSGRIADEDVIASDPELAELSTLLAGHTVEEHRKILAANKKAAREEIDQIPPRIQEAKLLSDSPAEAPAGVEAIESEIAELERKRATLGAGGLAAEKRAELAELRAKAQEIVNELTGAARTNRLEAEAKLDGLNRKVNETHIACDHLERGIASLEGDLETMAAQRARLLQEREEIQAETFAPTLQTVCPACEQPLPTDRVEAAREKALAQHNDRKARRLEDNKTAGIALKSRREKAEADLAMARDRLEAARGDHAKYAAYAQDAEDALRYLAVPDPSEHVPYIDNKAAQVRLEREIAEIEAGGKGQLEEIDARLVEKRAALAQAKEAQARVKVRAQVADRIATLEARQSELAAILEEHERQTWLCEQFVRAHVRLLETRINTHFHLATFRLFEEQLNGGLSECCTPMLSGVPYDSNLSTSERIKLGLDVIETLGAHWERRLPVFVDCAESILEVPPTTAQQIRLVVAEGDLTVEPVPLTSDVPLPSGSAPAAKPKTPKAKPAEDFALVSP